MFKIIIAPFPFLEINKSKNRPLVVLQDSPQTNTCIVAFLTSKTDKHTLDSDITINCTEEIKNTSGLVSDTVIRLHKIGSIDKASITQELGNIPDELKLEIQSKIKQLFQL
jgi:mRNA-degrading endonuclease toxin of MazEF toxin-antitoxin module